MPEFGTLCLPGSQGAHQGRAQPEGETQPVPKVKELWGVRFNSEEKGWSNLESAGSLTPVPESRSAPWRNATRAKIARC